MQNAQVSRFTTAKVTTHKIKIQVECNLVKKLFKIS